MQDEMQKQDKTSEERTGIAVWLIGIVGILFGTVEQFLVNESRIVAGVILIAGCVLLLWLWKRKYELKKWQLWLIRVVTALHVIGVFSDRWLVYTGLGVLTAVAGLVLTVLGLLQHKTKHPIVKVGESAFSIVAGLLAFIILGITFFPKASFSVFKNAINAYGNVTSAERYEDTLENGSRVIANIQYDTVYPNGFLDVYYTATPRSENPPTLLFIHGGGYANGDKSSGDPNAGEVDYRDSLAYRALNEGYNVVQFNYCLMTEHVFPDAIIQLNSGLKYLKDNATDLALNMDAVFLSGGSAGGNLAGVMANLQTNPEYAAEMGITPALDSDDIRGVVFISALLDNSQYGVTHNIVIDYMFYWAGRVYLNTNDLVYNKEASRLSNVIDNVSANYPPSLISDGNSGSFFDQAFAMNARLIELGVECKLIYYPKTVATLAHGYEDLGSDYAKITQDRMIEFMNAHAD